MLAICTRLSVRARHEAGLNDAVIDAVGGSAKGRAAILYCAAELFACRRCYGLLYASQQQTALDRCLEQARKIRMRLGGGVDLLEPFPGRPKGMHRRTFLRLRARAEAAMLGT